MELPDNKRALAVVAAAGPYQPAVELHKSDTCRRYLDTAVERRPFSVRSDTAEVVGIDTESTTMDPDDCS